MNEEDLLYREMNEEDPYYMGYTSNRHRQNPHIRAKSYKKDTPRGHNNPRVGNNKGCLATFIGFIWVCLMVFILMQIFC